MVEILKVTAVWSGWNGGPGYTNLYFRDFSEGPVDQAMADGAVLKTDVWLDAWAGQAIPDSISVLINPTVEVIEASNGQLQRFYTTAPDTSRVGTWGGTYSAASGACVTWYTDLIRNGRRVRGRSFMVPMIGAAYGTDGTIDNGKLTTLRNATATFISPAGTGDLGVWSRPSAPGATDGQWAFATSYAIRDKVAILRSRRD